MKIDIALDSPGSENVLRQRRDQQTATNAWLRQMEMAMLVQPSPPQSERRGLPSSHPDVSSVAATGRDPGLTVNTRGAASREVEPSGKWAASRLTMDHDSGLANGAPVEAGAWSRDAGAVSEVVDTQASSASQVSTAPGAASARSEWGQSRVGAQINAGISASTPDELSGRAVPEVGTTAVVGQISAGVDPAKRAAGQGDGRSVVQSAAATDYRSDSPMSTQAASPSQRVAMGSLSIARWGGPDGTDAAATEATEPDLPPELAAEPDDPPGKRAMHLTRDGSGVHVSIRDTGLDATAQWTLIGRLAAQLQGSGLNLRGMTINGDRRYERIDEDQAQLGDLFVTSPRNPDTAPKTSRVLRGDDHAG